MTTTVGRQLLKKDFAVSSIVRQTVLDGGVDSNGFANFLSAGAGLSVDISATSKAIQLAFASGFDGGGAKDLISEINADTNISGLAPNATNYLYVDRNPTTGAITYGAIKNLPPIYGTTYLKADGVGRSYSSFDGSDAATAFTDANGNPWTFVGNAQLDTAQKKFGTSSLLLDGSGDYLNLAGTTLHAGENEGGFEIVVWFRMSGGTGTRRNIISGNSTAHMQIHKSTSEKIGFAFGNGTSWFINPTDGTTTMLVDTWYRARCVWDGATYKLYLSNNGAAETEEVSITNSTAFASEPLGINVGVSPDSTFFSGWVDEFSYQVGPQTHGTVTPSVSARGELQADSENMFNLNSFKMNEWDQTNGLYVEKQRVFLGEAVTDGSSVTSLITYALKGQYESGPQTIAASTDYLFNHNLGLIPLIFDVDIKNVMNDIGWIPGDIIRGVHYKQGSVNGAWGIGVRRLTIDLITGTSIINAGKSSNDSADFTFSRWKALYKCGRGW